MSNCNCRDAFMWGIHDDDCQIGLLQSQLAEAKAERDALVEAARAVWLGAESDVDISVVDTADLKALAALTKEKRGD